MKLSTMKPLNTGCARKLYGSAVLVDPGPTGTPQAPGTLQWGGAYGHSWFIDRANRLSVVALTNTAFEGMSGAFPTEIRNAVYG